MKRKIRQHLRKTFGEPKPKLNHWSFKDYGSRLETHLWLVELGYEEATNCIFRPLILETKKPHQYKFEDNLDLLWEEILPLQTPESWSPIIRVQRKIDRERVPELGAVECKLGKFGEVFTHELQFIKSHRSVFEPEFNIPSLRYGWSVYEENLRESPQDLVSAAMDIVSRDGEHNAYIAGTFQPNRNGDVFTPEVLENAFDEITNTSVYRSAMVSPGTVVVVGTPQYVGSYQPMTLPGSSVPTVPNRSFSMGTSVSMDIECTHCIKPKPTDKIVKKTRWQFLRE